MRKDSRPNILFIMADQFRHDYIGCAGAGFVRTPNLDRIAARGVRFTQCVSNAPVCSPARIGLAAGMEPLRMGSLDNMSYLPAGTRTYYSRLRDAEYRVGCVGKVDLAKPDPWNGINGDRPCMYTYGFTHPVEIEGKMHAGLRDEPQGPYGLWLHSRGLWQQFRQDWAARLAKGWIKGASHDSVLPLEAWEDVYIGRRSVGWLESITQDYPWHLFVSFVGPHDPFDPPGEFAQRYRDAEVPPPIADSYAGKPAWHSRRNLKLSAEEVAHTRRQYCAEIEAIDDQIGWIMAALESRGMAENTYVVFSSDHGEMLGDHGIYTKSTAYESSLRVPLIVAGPGIAGGRVSDAIIELIDINPTICELAGLEAQEGIDARSFAPILRGQADSHRGEAVAALRHWRCIRTERYKLVDNYNDVCELYDLAEDPCELNNLAPHRKDLTRQLAERMKDRFMEDKWRR